MIAKIIKTLQLTPDLLRVVCSRQGDSLKLNQAKLGKNYPIESTLDPVKKINFYTSTCFEGCDIVDKKGKTYIVSDGNRSHTLVDISTLLIQICGRIRNSEFKNQITHIFSKTRYTGSVTLDEYEEKIMSNYKISQK